jgi:hypothetical protein
VVVVAESATDIVVTAEIPGLDDKDSRSPSAATF